MQRGVFATVTFLPQCESTGSEIREHTDKAVWGRVTVLPRLEKDNLKANLSIVEALKVLAGEKAATPAQIALAWLLAQNDNIVPIPGTKRIKYLEENVAAADLILSPEELSALSRAVSATAVSGERYTPEGMKGVNV